MSVLPARTLRLIILFISALGLPLWAQCPDGSLPPCTARPARLPAANSLAVLYFESQSSNTNDAYLADGITQEVIQTPAGVTRLKVQ